MPTVFEKKINNVMPGTGTCICVLLSIIPVFYFFRRFRRYDDDGRDAAAAGSDLAQRAD
jgi:hypothetical protein